MFHINPPPTRVVGSRDDGARHRPRSGEMPFYLIAGLCCSHDLPRPWVRSGSKADPWATPWNTIPQSVPRCPAVVCCRRSAPLGRPGHGLRSGLKADLGVGAVAERLLCRCAAAAEPDLALGG